MLKICLVDDDVEFLTRLQASIERHLGANEIVGAVAAFSQSKAFWEHFKFDPPDIVFLDIMMPDDNGIHIARAIHATAPKTRIVFLTSSVEFAMEGYGVNAVFYLLKPLADDKIALAIDTCRQRLTQTRRLFIKNGGSTTGVELCAITHLESVNRQVVIHTRSEKHIYRGKLSDLATTLPSEFTQVHKSFFVNMDHVSMVKYNMVVLDGGSTIPISRRFRKDATDRFFSRMAPPL